MSRRTSEASRAIREAWDNEQKLVSEGTGTRNWTQEQQKDILERGKAYDEYGRAFEGQHMRSAEMYPECQGDPKNIQFLTREEHLAAHDGDWRNPTNWYYNPITREKLDFGDGPIIPCKVIELSNPLNIFIAREFDANSNEALNEMPSKEINNAPPSIGIKLNESRQATVNINKPQINNKVLNYLKRGAKFAREFVANHKEEIIAGAMMIGSAILKNVVDSNGSGSSTSVRSINHLNTNSNSASSYSSDDASALFDSDEIKQCENDYPDERQSPRAHDVSGYTRHWNGKEIHVDSYKRGGKKEE